MKIVARMELKPGMVLGEGVFYQDRCIFPTDTVLDDEIIGKLKRYSIMCVTIKENIDLATTRYEKIRYDVKFQNFEKAFSSALLQFKHLMKEFLQTKNKIEDDKLLQIYYDLYTYIPSGSVMLDYLYTMMPSEDELTYTHCLSSALLSGTLADWLSMNEESRKTLILCGFYYDIGKLLLPYQLLWKPGKLTPEEYETVKQHTIIGYDLIKNLNIRQHVKNAVIMHHERIDGSGYPFHLNASTIDIYARYMAIVDAYIAMAAPRSYRAALTPLQIIGNFEKNIDKYDAELLLPIMKRIADAQIGNHVVLENGSEWEVFIIHPMTLSRPLLKNKENEFYDLAEHPEMAFR